MIDPLNALGAAASAGRKADAFSSEAAKVGSALWGKVLGPPAEAYGEHLRARIEAWSEDKLTARVLKRAARKIDPDRPGTVPPRVAADVFDKAQWAEDDFLTEYLSGVLASARTPDGTDDSAVAWTALVGRMSSAQLRLHYVLYAAVRQRFYGEEFANGHELTATHLLVEYRDLIEALNWPANGDETYTRMLDAAYGLEREGLVQGLGHGGRAFWDRNWVPVHRKHLPDGIGYISFQITPSGALLFLRAHAVTNEWSMGLIDPAVKCEFVGPAEQAPGSATVWAFDELEPF